MPLDPTGEHQKQQLQGRSVTPYDTVASQQPCWLGASASAPQMRIRTQSANSPDALSVLPCVHPCPARRSPLRPIHSRRHRTEKVDLPSPLTYSNRHGWSKHEHAAGNEGRRRGHRPVVILQHLDRARALPSACSRPLSVPRRPSAGNRCSTLT
jgi:hypothetical protein